MVSVWHLLFLVALGRVASMDRSRSRMFFGCEPEHVTSAALALAAFYGVDVAHWLPNMPRGSERLKGRCVPVIHAAAIPDWREMAAQGWARADRSDGRP